MRARHMVSSAMIAEDPQMVGALDERIPILDEAGIDGEVLSTGINNGSFFDDSAYNAEMARATNDEFSAAAQRHPGRYRFFATLPCRTYVKAWMS